MKPLTFNDMPQHRQARQKLKARLAAQNLISLEEVESRITRAILTLSVQPDHEKNWQRMKSHWPQYVQEALAPADAQFVRNEEINRSKPFQATPQDISRYLDDLSWLVALDDFDRQLIGWRARGWSFAYMAEYLCECEDENMSQRKVEYAYKKAVSNCWLVAAFTAERKAQKENSAKKWSPGAYRARA